VLKQTYQQFEIIVVDDASTDNTPEVMRSIADERVRYIRHERNKGVSAARNAAITASKGNLIAFLDADDDWLPDKLQNQVKRFTEASGNTGLVYGGCLIVDEATQRPIRLVIPKRRGFVAEHLLMRDFIMSPTPIVRRDCFDKVGLFSEDMHTSEDWDMWFRIAQYYDLDYVKDLVARYFVTPDQATKDSTKVIDGYKRFMSKHEALIAGKPAILAHHFKAIGHTHLLYGEFDMARIYLAKAIRANPRNPSLYIHWLACRIAPAMYTAAGKWINKSIERIRYRWPA